MTVLATGALFTLALYAAYRALHALPEWARACIADEEPTP